MPWRKLSYEVLSLEVKIGSIHRLCLCYLPALARYGVRTGERWELFGEL